MSLSEGLLSDCGRLLAEHTALHFPRERWADLERGLRAAAPAFGCEGAEACAQYLLSTPLTRKNVEILAAELTVGETYFLREKESLRLLCEQVIPEIMENRRDGEHRLRIWSAGCCTGEEPYTIALMLDRFLPSLRSWQVTVRATDLNPVFLRKASEGIFSEWSFRDAPPWLKETYFQRHDAKHFALIPRIKQKVTFSYLNLAEDVYPSLPTDTNAMDLILCRNVLMYFSEEGVKRIVRRFHQSLVSGGWLVVSPTEVSGAAYTEAGFVPVQFGQMTFYRKGDPSLFPEKPYFQEPAFEFPEPVVLPPLPTLEREEEPVREAETVATRPAPEQAAAMARRCANTGDLAQALSWAEKALAADKLDAGLHYLHAMILQERGAEEEAGASFKRALYLDPRFILAHFALGNLALRQGKSGEAGHHFANVLALLADYPSSDILPQSDGLAAGRLKEMVESAKSMEKIS